MIPVTSGHVSSLHDKILPSKNAFDPLRTVVWNGQEKLKFSLWTLEVSQKDDTN